MNNINNNRYANLDVNNPAPRCPVILLLDTSGSMCNDMDELNAALRQFLRETAADEAASRSVELEVITFDNSAEVAMPFTAIADVDPEPDPLVSGGITAMGAALQLATEHLRERRKLYKTNGISSYKPWVILMTDGGPNDDWESAAQEMRERGERGDLQYIGVEIGNDVDHETMVRILPENQQPVKLKDKCFKQFFRWVTASISSVSSSAVSDQDNICFGDPTDWADL
ncbi:MAG: VWA domain-containing protein [Victivallaceae bacterium]|nr:VWA domain-containing protein [Victivallaceae bacterium]